MPEICPSNSLSPRSLYFLPAMAQFLFKTFRHLGSVRNDFLIFLELFSDFLTVIGQRLILRRHNNQDSADAQPPEIGHLLSKSATKYKFSEK